MKSIQQETTMINPIYVDISSQEQPSTYYEEVVRNKNSAPNDLVTGKRIFFILVAFACILSVLSIAVTVLILFGKIQLTESCTCSRQEGAQQSSSAPYRMDKEFQKKLMKFKLVNLTTLETTLATKNRELADSRGRIRQLEQKVDHLAKELSNVSKLQGPPGTRGYNGSQGLPGPRGPAGSQGHQGPQGQNGKNGSTSQAGPEKLASCHYKKVYSPGVTLTKNANADVFLPEPSGKRIMGATCSTNKGAEYQFSSFLHPRTKVLTFKCWCRGESALFIKPASDNTLICYIHYWECPLSN